MSLTTSSEEKSEQGQIYRKSGIHQSRENKLLIHLKSDRSIEAADALADDRFELIRVHAMEENSDEIGEETSGSINESLANKQFPSVITTLPSKDPILTGWEKSAEMVKLPLLRVRTEEWDGDMGMLKKKHPQETFEVSFKAPALEDDLGGESLRAAQTDILRLKKDKDRYWKDRNWYRKELDSSRTAQVKMNNECGTLKRKLSKLSSELEVEKGNRARFERELRRLLKVLNVEGGDGEDCFSEKSLGKRALEDMFKKVQVLQEENKSFTKSEERASKAQTRSLDNGLEQGLHQTDKLRHARDSRMSCVLLNPTDGIQNMRNFLKKSIKGELLAVSMLQSPEDEVKHLRGFLEKNVAGEIENQAEQLQKLDELYQWGMHKLQSKIKDLEANLKQKQENWLPNDRHKKEMAELCEKHKRELTTRDHTNRRKITRIKYKGLQDLADLRADLTEELQENWREYMEQSEAELSAAKSEIRSLREQLGSGKAMGEKTEEETKNLKRNVEARKLREADLEDRISQLEIISAGEAKEALRLATTLGNVKAELKMKTQEQESKNLRYRKLEEEVQELRQSRTELLLNLDEKGEQERTARLENIDLTLRCEFLEAEILDLRNLLSINKIERARSDSALVERKNPGFAIKRTRKKTQESKKTNQGAPLQLKKDSSNGVTHGLVRSPNRYTSSQPKLTIGQPTRDRPLPNVQKKKSNKSQQQSFPRRQLENFKQRTRSLYSPRGKPRAIVERGSEGSKVNEASNIDSQLSGDSRQFWNNHEKAKVNFRPNASAPNLHVGDSLPLRDFMKCKSAPASQYNSLSYSPPKRIRQFNLSMSLITEDSEMSSNKIEGFSLVDLQHKDGHIQPTRIKVDQPQVDVWDFARRRFCTDSPVSLSSVIAWPLKAGEIATSLADDDEMALQYEDILHSRAISEGESSFNGNLHDVFDLQTIIV